MRNKVHEENILRALYEMQKEKGVVNITFEEYKRNFDETRRHNREDRKS